jgi:hypothetical protein
MFTYGKATAVLFAGKKSDKTLLAVGTISHVDGETISSLGGALITANTKSVSFELNALTGTVSNDVNKSSFLTDSDGGVISPSSTKVTDFSIASRIFPLYGLPAGAIRHAKYTIDVNAPHVHQLSYYSTGIILAGGSNTIRIEPKYTESNGTERKSKLFSYDTVSTLTLISNNIAGTAFSGEVDFTINTGNPSTPGPGDKPLIIFAIKFWIPVYALSVGSNPIPWVIRPGYDQYNEELDDGRGGIGGAILIGLRGLEQFESSIRLLVAKPPDKIQYNLKTGYNFNPAGALIYLVNGEDSVIRTLSVNDANLKFSYDLSGSNNYTYIPTVYNFPNNINKSVLIRVEYFDGAETYYGTFTITVTTLSFEFEEIPDGRRKIISKQTDFNNAMDDAAGIAGGTFLFVIASSIDLSAYYHSFSAPCTIIVMANAPDVIIGRTNNNGTFSGSDNVFFYFGAWPLNEPAMAGGDILTGYPYKINAKGSYQDFPNGDPVITTNLISGTNLTVLVGPDVECAHEAYLPYTP